MGYARYDVIYKCVQYNKHERGDIFFLQTISFLNYPIGLDWLPFQNIVKNFKFYISDFRILTNDSTSKVQT